MENCSLYINIKKTMRLIDLKLKDNSDESVSVCIHSAGNYVYI